MRLPPCHVAELCLFAVVLLAGPAPAAEIYWQGVERAAQALLPDQPDGARPFLDALEKRAEESLARLEHPRDRAAWEQATPELRKRLRAALGIDRLPRPQPRNVSHVGTVDRGDYVIEKIVYETFPDCPVAVHVYRPAKVEGKLPTVLYAPGHSWAEGKSHPDTQALGATLARDGFLMLAYDPHGEGERGISFRDHRRTELLLAGVCQEAVPVFESSCALEYLLSRPDVDPRRVGITGESGGGYNTWIMLALEPRLAVGVPVVGTSEFYEQLHVTRPLDWYMAREHCHFVPGLLTFANNHEYLALAAPRPVLVIAADKDDSFRLPGIRKVVGFGRELYKALDKPEHLDYFEDQQTAHGYQKPKREAAHGWFRRWLQGKGRGAPVAESDVPTLPADAPELRCFPAGKNQPAGPGIMAQISRLFDTLPEPQEPPTADVLRKTLAETLGVPLPDGEVKLTRGRQRREGGVLTERLQWPAPDGVTVPALLIVPPGTPRGVVLAAGDAGKEELLRNPILRTAVESGLAVVAVDVRGTGELSPHKPGWVFATSLLLGENFVGRQALDLVSGRRALAEYPELRGRPAGVFGSGPSAAQAALYAAVLDPEFAWLAAEGGFVSFRSFVERPEALRTSYRLAPSFAAAWDTTDREIPAQLFVFDVLHHFDLPDLFAALAPRPALIVRPLSGEWQPLAEDEARRLLRRGRFRREAVATVATGEGAGATTQMFLRHGTNKK